MWHFVLPSVGGKSEDCKKWTSGGDHQIVNNLHQKPSLDIVNFIETNVDTFAPKKLFHFKVFFNVRTSFFEI